MAADCAIELYRSKVAMVSLWPGAVRTEKIEGYMEKEGAKAGESTFNKVNLPLV